MKTTTTTKENENAKTMVQTVPTYYEHLYNVANSAVNAVLRNRYNQTGVPLYRELNEYRNQLHDKALYTANCGGYGLGEVEAMKNKLTEDKKQLATKVRDAEKACTDLTLTGATRKAKAKDFLQKSRDYADICREVKRLSEDIKTIKAYNGKVTYSDRMGLINSAICGFLGYKWDNSKEYGENYSLQYKAMCKAISESMTELCNPQVENTYRNKAVRIATDTEIKDFIKAVGGIGREYKYYSTSYGAYRTFYTIEERKAEKWIIKHYATVNQYQYIEAMGTNDNDEAVTPDSILTKACKDYTRYDNYFVSDMGDIESLLDLMHNIKATEREQLFIKEVGKVAKLYDDVKDVLNVAMVRIGIISDTAKRKFISRLRKKLIDNGCTYKSVRASKMPFNKAVKVQEGKRVDLLEWAFKAIKERENVNVENVENSVESVENNDSQNIWRTSTDTEKMLKKRAIKYAEIFANSRIK